MRKSNFALRLQPSLYEAAREFAQQEGVALNQLINVAVAQLLAANSASTYLAARARRGSRQSALEILQRAGGDNAPMPGDELPAGWTGLPAKAGAAAKPRSRRATRKK